MKKETNIKRIKKTTRRKSFAAALTENCGSNSNFKGPMFWSIGGR